MSSKDWTRKEWEEWYKKTMYSFDIERKSVKEIGIEQEKYYQK
jgi:hypothetical protein